jgi:hypothetical protein
MYNVLYNLRKFLLDRLCGVEQPIMPGRARPITDEETWSSLASVLQQIEDCARALASERKIDLRIEKNEGGKFPAVTLRARGFLTHDDESRHVETLRGYMTPPTRS